MFQKIINLERVQLVITKPCNCNYYDEGEISGQSTCKGHVRYCNVYVKGECKIHVIDMIYTCCKILWTYKDYVRDICNCMGHVMIQKNTTVRLSYYHLSGMLWEV